MSSDAATEAAERVGLDIFKADDAAGERVTLAMVERRLAELAGHPPDQLPAFAAR